MNLRDLYQSLSKEERDAFAARLGIKPAYLWQIAVQWKGKEGRAKRPSLELLKKIAETDPRLTVVGLVDEFTEEASPHGTANGKRRKPAATERKQPKPTDKPSRNKGR